MRSSPMNMVFGLATLALALYVLPVALAGNAAKQLTPEPCWSAPLNWVKSCCPPDMLTCSPEPTYSQPDSVCPTCLCNSEAEVSPPECVSPLGLSAEDPQYCQPESVAGDPEAHWRNACPVHVPKDASPSK